MIHGKVGVATSLDLQLGDGNTGKFPQALLFLPAAAVPFATLDMSHRSNGYYEVAYSFSVGRYNVQFVVYKNLAHTLLDNKYDRIIDEVLVTTEDVDSVATLIKRCLGLAQENFRIFSPVYDVSHNLLSSIVKLYPSKADAVADTNMFATYTMTAAYNLANEMTAYQMVKEP